jgi:hypothetical protein
MNAMTPIRPFTLLDVGRRINALSVQQGAIDLAQMELEEKTPAYIASEAAMRFVLDEGEKAAQLALAMQPQTLADAAVQAGILFEAVALVRACDLESQLRSGDLERDLAAFERALARIALVVASAAGIDLNEIGQSDLAQRIDRHAPQFMADEYVQL